MSPKSRGRPKGSGRARQTRRNEPVRTITPVDRVLREATRLAGEDLLYVRLAASDWLGRAWSERAMGARDLGTPLVERLVAATEGARAHAAYVALQALATISQEPWGPVVQAALVDLHDDHRMPWADAPLEAPRPISARTLSDPWGSNLVQILRYEQPTDHTMMVMVRTDGGLWVEGIQVGQQQGEPPDVPGMPSEERDVTEVLADVADALFTTDLYWPPQQDPDYVQRRALVRWATAGHLRHADIVPITDDERRSLIEDFLQSQGLDRGDLASTPGVLADTFVDFGDGYLHGRVLGWTPGEVERFMLDWAQRKVILEPEDRKALPEVLAQWVDFALTRRGLARLDIDAVVEVVHECAEEFHDLADVDEGGPARELVKRVLAAGVDPGDKAGADRVIGAYNAELNARRLLDS